MDKQTPAAATRKMYARLEEETPRVVYNERLIDRPAEGIVLVNPKYPHNVGAAVRAACVFRVRARGIQRAVSIRSQG